MFCTLQGLQTLYGKYRLRIFIVTLHAATAVMVHDILRESLSSSPLHRKGKVKAKMFR